MAISAGSLGSRQQRTKPSCGFRGVSRWWGRGSGGKCQGSDPRQRAGGKRRASGFSAVGVMSSGEWVAEAAGRGEGDRGARGRSRPSWAGRPRVAGRWRVEAGGEAATSWRRRPRPLSALSAGAGSPRPPPCPIRPASKVTAPWAARGEGAPGRPRASRAGYGTSSAGVGPGGREPVSRCRPGLCALRAFWSRALPACIPPSPARPPPRYRLTRNSQKRRKLVSEEAWVKGACLPPPLTVSRLSPFLSGRGDLKQWRRLGLLLL